MSKLLSTAEASERLNVPLRTLRHWIARGEAPKSFRLGRRRMFRAEDVEAFIDAAIARESAGQPEVRS